MRNPRTECASSRGPPRGLAPPTPVPRMTGSGRDPTNCGQKHGEGGTLSATRGHSPGRSGTPSATRRQSPGRNGTPPATRRHPPEPEPHAITPSAGSHVAGGGHPFRHPQAIAGAGAARDHAKRRQPRGWGPIPAPAGDSPSALRAWGRPHSNSGGHPGTPFRHPRACVPPPVREGLGGTPRAMGYLPLERSREWGERGRGSTTSAPSGVNTPGPHRRRCLSRPAERQFTAWHTPRTADRSASPPSARAPAPDQSRP